MSCLSPSSATAAAEEQAKRPPFEVADVVRGHGARFCATHRVSVEQRRVLRAIERCRTAVLGGHVEQCEDCGATRIAYNSCRNRHCPKCQGPERAKWLAAQQALLLPVPYFHVVFTLPRALGALIRVNPRRLYNLLFGAATATLQEFAADPKHLGAELGITAVLHTWGQTLTQHVHLHCVVTGGGLGRDGRRWIPLPKRRRRALFLFPVRALSAVFRRTFCHGLQMLWQRGELRFAGQCASLRGRVEWARLRHTLESVPWVVYAKPPFGGPEVVLKYLSRYTHRVAISNQRILHVGNGAVRFAYRDYADANKHKVMELTAEEFLRRFLLHVLPPGLKRIRHFGLLANRHRRHKIARCRQLLGQPPSSSLSVPELATAEPSDSHSDRAAPAPMRRRCEACGGQRLRTIELLPPIRDGPALP